MWLYVLVAVLYRLISPTNLRLNSADNIFFCFFRLSKGVVLLLGLSENAELH